MAIGYPPDSELAAAGSLDELTEKVQFHGFAERTNDRAMDRCQVSSMTGDGLLA